MLIRGRNCEKEIEKCIRSIQRQTYPYWKAVISLDAPTDNSFVKLHNILKLQTVYKFDCFVGDTQVGVCGNMYRVVKQAELVFSPTDSDVAVVVDADDFISKDALATIEKAYREHDNIAVTHGSYLKMSKGKRTRVSKANPIKGDIRKLPWRSSHLKSIKWGILKQINKYWFMHKGKWLEAASDLALMFPCIEIAGLENVHYIHKVIYYWNDHVTKRKRVLEKKCEKIIRNKKGVV